MAEIERDEAGYMKVVRVDDIPEGEGRTLEAAGWWVALFHAGGAFYAIDNACPHMAGPLGAGRLDGYVVTCPLHAWPFDVRTGCAPTNDLVRVPRFDVRVEEGWVWLRVLPPTRREPSVP